MQFEDFVVITLKVRKEDYERFKRYVLNKYGKLRGVLGLEASEAFRFYLEYHEKHPIANVKKHLEKPRKKHLKLLYWLYNFKDDIIPDRVIDYYLKTELGIVSKPTLRDYWNFVKAFLWESHVDRSTKPVTVYYEIRKDEIKEFLEKHGVKLDETEFKPQKIIEREKRIRGIEITPEEKRLFELMDRITIRDVAEYARERYEAGDSLEEIADKLEDLGFNFSKSQIRNFIRSVMRYERRN